jgi:hypothetical protein
MKLSKLLSLVPLCAALLMSGCASVSMMQAEDDSRGKSFAAEKDKANIYLYRNETFGAAIKMPVTVNGKLAGQTASKTYFLWQVAPGTYDIGSVTGNSSTVKLMVEGGKSYYVWQEVKMGMFQAGSELKQVDEDTGRKGVLECSRAESAI